MFITNLFKHECMHEHVTPDKESAYCPDCGKFIKNEWYITRCECCGVKLKAMSKKGKIVPQYNYCYNCGCREYKVEKLDEINFVDVRFAVLVKQIIENKKNIYSTTTCWQEKTNEIPKLLVLYL